MLISIFVVFIYAQTRTGSTLAIANDSQAKIENNISDNNLGNTTQEVNNIQEVDKKSVKKADSGTATNHAAGQQDDDKKLVKKTALVTSSKAGASRGAFSASAYCFTGRTATGQKVRRGIIAADPRVLKLGSTVYVNAGQWSGTYLVADTGGSIKGKKIDIWVPGCSEARKFGRRKVEVFSVQ